MQKSYIFTQFTRGHVGYGPMYTSDAFHIVESPPSIYPARSNGYHVVHSPTNLDNLHHRCDPSNRMTVAQSRVNSWMTDIILRVCEKSGFLVLRVAR